MVTYLLGLAVCVGLGLQSVDEPIAILRGSLPDSGVLHLVYTSPNVVGGIEIWIDFETASVLQVKGTEAVLRDSEGRYSRGAGANARTGEPLGWEPDRPSFAQALMNIRNPVAQAVLLIAERDRLSGVRTTEDGWMIDWEAPAYKVWRSSDDGPIEVDGASLLQFNISSAGRVLSWQYIAAEPEIRQGPVVQHDYTDCVFVGDTAVPQYIDMAGKLRRSSESGIWNLETMEFFDEYPMKIFTRDGALARAAEASIPMQQAYANSFYWHDSPDAAAHEARPFLDPISKSSSSSLSLALLTGGALVFLFGVYAWWRSRR